MAAGIWEGPFSPCRLKRRRLLTLAAAGLVAGQGVARAAASAAVRPAGDLIGTLAWYVTDGQQTLLDVARRHDLGILELSAANPGVDVWVPGEGRPVLLPTAHLLPAVERRGIVINKAELRLYWFRDDGSIETHPIGVGREGFDTPLGQTRIVRKQAAPTWRPTASARADNPDLPAVVGPGPDNPLGDFALYFDWPTYLMHGTNKPFGVGRRVSRGCIRMYPEDIAHLFEAVPVGTPVDVVEQPVKTGWSAGEFYVEVHPDILQLDHLEATYQSFPNPARGVAERVRAEAGPALARVDWDAVEAEARARRGVPVKVTRTPGAKAGEAKVERGFGGVY